MVIALRIKILDSLWKIGDTFHVSFVLIEIVSQSSNCRPDDDLLELCSVASSCHMIIVN